LRGCSVVADRKDMRAATLILLIIAVALIVARGRAGLHDAEIAVLPLAVLASYYWVYYSGVEHGREDEREAHHG
jgi:hypothetical protein